jgi:arylsulfatase A-like enzyme
VWDDTALVVAGTGGVELGEHRWAGPLHSSSARVPLIFHHPGSVPGTRVLDDVVELTDVAPTLLDWLGLEPAPSGTRGRQGRSLVPLLTNTGAAALPSRPAAMVGAAGEQSGSLRDGRWTLVWRKPRSGEEEVRLYDRGRDPLELLDVRAHHPDRARRMRNELLRILTEVDS